MRILLISATLSAAFHMGCGVAPASGPDRASNTERVPDGSIRGLWLELSGDETVQILHSCPAGTGPRLAELWLRAKNVKGIRSSEAGEAAERAGKEVHVQQKDDGLFRIIVMSSQNTSTIESGVLASLELEREADGPMRVEILTDRPMFAPQEAQQGLTVGDPIEL